MPETLEEHAVKIRQSLVDHGYRENVPDWAEFRGPSADSSPGVSRQFG